MPVSKADSGEEDNASLSQVLDENFECLSRVAESVCKTLCRPKDRTVCRSTIAEMAKFNQSESIEAKQNVRTFMRLYLKVLRWTQKNQPIRLYERWYGAACHSGASEGQQTSVKENGQNEKHFWLVEGYSFLAMKHLEDGSTMIYSAVSKDSAMGWLENGFKTLNEQLDKSECD